MSLHSTVQRLSERSQAAIQRLWDQHEAGEVTTAEFKALAGAQLARDQVRASSVAVLALGAELSRQNRRVTVTPAAVVPDDPQAEAEAAIAEQETTQVYDQDPRKAYGIAAGAVVMAAYQGASTAALRDTSEFFQRVAGPEACDLCIDLSDVALPVHLAESQYHHKGCQCTYQPISANEL